MVLLGINIHMMSVRLFIANISLIISSDFLFCFGHPEESEAGRDDEMMFADWPTTVVYFHDEPNKREILL